MVEKEGENETEGEMKTSENEKNSNFFLSHANRTKRNWHDSMRQQIRFFCCDLRLTLNNFEIILAAG